MGDQSVNVRLGDEACFLRPTCCFKGEVKRPTLAVLPDCSIRVGIIKSFSNVFTAEHGFAVNLNGANLPELGIVE